MSKLLTISLMTLSGLALALTASAHVHGITPLGACTVDNPNSGASAAEGKGNSPITGIIPRDVGSSPLDIGDGGFGATGTHCP